MKHSFVSPPASLRRRGNYSVQKPTKVLIASENPPKTYTDALYTVGLDYDFSLSPKNTDDYGGLLLIGGGDIFTAYYGGNIRCRNVDFVKDKLEFNLLYNFVGKNKPVLAVCRGFQLVNVFFGGTLKCVSGHTGKQDIYHPVASAEGIFGDFEEVNSRHRQAVCNLPPEAKLLSVAPDLTAEAAIYGNNVICVQFHPERLSRFATEKIYGEFKRLIYR